MRQFVTCKDEAERNELLTKLREMGWTWDSGAALEPLWMEGLTLGYDSTYRGITHGWDEVGGNGKETTIPRFLISMEIQKLKAQRRALPKLGEGPLGSKP